MTATFIPGLQLSSLFFFEIIKPILDLKFSEIQYSAALIGGGSEVLGFDTEMSRDHDWGPRVKLFLSEDVFVDKAKTLEALIKANLPTHFRDYPVKWTIDGPSENPCVEFLTIRSFILDYLQFDIHDEIKPADWLTFSEHKLRAITSGAIYWDDLGLQATLDRFHYYPKDIWLYLLSAQWQRIGQEEHLMGRAGIVGDEIGSALIAARLVRDLMHLWFLMEKQYAPYAKWFGSAFAQLPGAEVLMPLLRQVLQASTWSERQNFLVPAYEMAAARHNAMQITEALIPKVSRFHDRPFLVIGGEQFSNAIREIINDPAVKQIADRWLIGNVDQFSDSTDLINEARSLHSLYE